VKQNENITITGGRTETVKKNENITIKGGRTETVNQDENITILGGRVESVKNDENVQVKANRTHGVKENDSLTVGKILKINAGEKIVLHTGKASITLHKNGTIEISGQDITVDGKGQITGKASKNVVWKGQKILQN
jgi:type VI secretion system secreted protein VgrG